ncbi:MAG: hypothetical protein HOA17_05975 [Candidatus Melainabacteria bacterium]|jgi:hypothetical protein|nr:hypothetical protein [Candidatus Melainabacteria bacterium]
MPLTGQELVEANTFLQRLQGQTVRVEVASRINIGFRQAMSVKLAKSTDLYTCTSESGEVAASIDLSQAESLSSDHSSVTLLYGDNLITIRFARSR